MPQIDHADLVLLVLGAPTADPNQTSRINGITRLEKLTFLLDQDSRFREVADMPTEPLHFRAYHYGPYTREIYDAVEMLVSIGLIDEHRHSSRSSLEVAEEISELDGGDLGILGAQDGPYVERIFELSDRGQYVANVLAKRVGDDAVAEISLVKDKYGGLPLRQLLRYVYAEHPEMTVRSRIKDKL